MTDLQRRPLVGANMGLLRFTNQVWAMQENTTARVLLTKYDMPLLLVYGRKVGFWFSPVSSKRGKVSGAILVLAG
jgi:hypothetical protein